MKGILLFIILFPFLGFLINGLGRNIFSKRFIAWHACLQILASFILSILAFLDVRSNGTTLIKYFDFINTGSINIPFELQIDPLSALFILIITGIGFLIHVYSTAYMKDESPSHYGRYFSYLNLFIFFMLILVLGGNYVIMFIGWEGVGLCSYLLIGYWFRNTEFNNAAKKAFIMNRIGDLGFLIAMFWLISTIGSVSFDEVFSKASLLSTTDITIITILLFVGAAGKSAQIPLYTWLPDAMAGPTPVSALIHAATMVTAGIYMIARSHVLYSLSEISQNVVAIIGLATAILGATIALKQNDIKKVLAYSTVSQLGYMFLALGVGAYTSAVFHVMTHAFFKALLFLAAGSVIHAMHHEQDIRNMGGLKKYLPATHLTFLIGCLAIAGIPPFSGFFSKDEILMATYSSNPVLFYFGLATSFMTAFYMFRLYTMTFLGGFRGNGHQHQPHESSPSMTVPLIILAILSIIGGFVGLPEIINDNLGTHHQLNKFLSPVIPLDISAHHLSPNTEYLLIAISVVGAIASIVFAVTRFKKYQKTGEPVHGIGKFLQNKWYIDELYNGMIVKPISKLGSFFNSVFEKSGIDAVVNGVGKVVQYGGRQMRWLQSGQVGSYVLLMVVSMLLLLVLQFFLRK